MGAARRMKWLVSHGVLYTAIALLGLSVISLHIMSESMHHDMMNRHRPLVDAAANIKYEVSRFHLWFEEALATGADTDLKISWRHLDSAEQSAISMLGGTGSARGGSAGLDDPALRQEIGHVLEMISALRTAADDRLARPEAAGIGTAADREFDAAYNKMLGHVEHVERALRQMIARDMARSEQFHRWMNLLVLLMTGAVGFVAYRSELRNRALAGRVREGAHRLKMLMEHANDAIFIADAENGVIIDVNRQACELIGRARSEIVGMHQSELHPVEEAEQYKEIFQQHVTSGSSQAFELYVLHSDGRHIPVDISASVIEIGGRRVIQGIFHDITRRKQAEDALRKYEILFSEANDLAYICDAEGNILFLNSAFDRLAGHRREAFIGKPFAPLVAADDLKKAEENYRRTLAGESPVFEVAFKKTGTVCEYKNIPQRDHEGNVIGVLGIARDVTERRRMEDVIKAERAFSDSLVTTAQVIVLVLNPDATVRYINPYMEELSGYRLSEVAGRDWFDTFLPKQDWSAVRTLFRQAISDVKTIGNINPILCRDGSQRSIEWYDKTLKDEHGQTMGLLAIGHDVSERLQDEMLIRAALEEKDMLLREIHHRVKNNLQVVSSLLSLQAHSATEGQNPDWLDEVQNRIRSMSLVHEHLSYSENLAAVDFTAYIKKVVNELCAAYGMNARHAKLDVRLDEVCCGLDQAVPLGLVLNELLVNSLKYAFPDNGEGTITITLGQLGDNEIELMVADDGIGLPKGYDWKKADSVGMQLVRGLVAQLEGEISLRSAAKGTCFVVHVKTSQEDCHGQ